jgi:hypothetical protein
MKRQEAMFILIATFVVVIAWIAFAIYESFNNSTISKTLSVQISPISATFNTKIIDTVKKRQQVNPLNLEIVATPTPASREAQTIPSAQTPTPIPTTPIASTSATGQLTETP